MRCPRQNEMFSAFRDKEYDDLYARGRCGYCGSMNPDEFMARLEAGTIRVTGTDKNYKLYVENLGGEPLEAIKFYFQHLSIEQQDRFIQLHNEKKINYDSFGLYVTPFFCTRNTQTQQ